MTDYTVDFEPIGRRGTCRDNQSILDCSEQLGIGISSICGGHGTCHSCKIRVLSGTVSKPTSSEREVFTSQELKSGWHLACQTYPGSDCKLNVPPQSMTATQRTQVEGLEIPVQPEPPVLAYRLEIPIPTLSHTQADADRLLELVNRQHRLHCERVDIDVLRKLSSQLRDLNWQCQASVRQNEVVAVGPWPSLQLGLSIDLGTTKIAGYLVDLNNGRTLASKGIMNPQISYGEDIISRITSVLIDSQKGAQLKEVAVEAINQLASALCGEVGANIEQIVETVVVGNTAMHHLLLGLPVRQLALSPYVPAVSMSLDLKARDLGLHIAPGAYIHLLPNIAGFVGADHVAVLLATQEKHEKGTVLVIDIGTNTEVSLINKGRITSVSCASGPAFEGFQIKHGMRASSGAIEHIRITGSEIQYQTIDKAPPVGICGSGILDALAQLYLAGILDDSGRFVGSHPHVRTQEGQREFILVKEKKANGYLDIVITQKDVRALQLAKAAIRSGIQILLEANGCSEADINRIIIAGAFGTYIDVSSAIAIGMLPALPLDRFDQVGNAAGTGARLALISLSKRNQARDMASRVNYIELATASNFRQTFLQAGYLGRYRLKNGKREKDD